MSPLFNFSTGNPSNLVAGNSASMTDIQGPFTDLRAFINGSQDETNVPNLTAAFTTYRMIAGPFKAVLGGSAAAGTYAMGEGETLSNTGFATVVGMQHAVYLPAGLLFTANARTTKYRLLTMLVTNSVAPGVNFTPLMHSVTAIAGGPGVTPTAQTSALVTGSNATQTTPGASTTFLVDSGDFNAPANAPFIFGVTTSGPLAANAAVVLVAQLYMRQV